MALSVVQGIAWTRLQYTRQEFRVGPRLPGREGTLQRARQKRRFTVQWKRAERQVSKVRRPYEPRGRRY